MPYNAFETPLRGINNASVEARGRSIYHRLARMNTDVSLFADGIATQLSGNIIHRAGARQALVLNEVVKHIFASHRNGKQ
jgi:hypothetical protein